MKVLLIGAGGLGSAAGLALARTGGVTLTVLDDDRVEASNLHRQVLYDDADLGLGKATRAAARLNAEGANAVAVCGRLLPETALVQVQDHDVVIEGSDNYATKFLAADACQIAGVPLVSAGCVRWSGWALATLPGRSACLRCVFEDLPAGDVETCATAGVVGPAVGVLGALQAVLALALVRGDDGVAGRLHSYRALHGVLRTSRVRPRRGCVGCAGDITELTYPRYAPTCGA
ncbi:MAG: ThiF family adenylyltransferase [Sandaracinaceae bacterium]